MADPNVPNRQQLILLANKDPELMRQLERLFQVAGAETPGNLDALAAAPTAAQINALAGQLADLVALQGLERATASVEPDDDTRPPEQPQERPDDTSPALVATLDGLADVDVPGAVIGSLLQYDGALWVPVSGATGTFTTVDAKTVTVTGGIITAIV